MTKLLLITGSGDLPKSILLSIEEKNQIHSSRPQTELMIIAIKNKRGICESADFFKTKVKEYHEIEITNIKGFFEIANRLKPDAIIIAGKVDKPDFTKININDNKQSIGSRIVKKLLSSRLFGDDLLLKAVTKKIEAGTGVKVVQVSKLLPQMLAGQKLSTNKVPSLQQKLAITKGFKLIKNLSKLDVSQSIVIGESSILGLEAAEGTDELIKRCSAYAKQKNSAILIKDAKHGQTFKADIPTIGLDTARLIIEHDYAGIAVKKGRVIVLNQPEFKLLLEKHDKFFYVM